PGGAERRGQPLEALVAARLDDRADQHLVDDLLAGAHRREQRRAVPGPRLGAERHAPRAELAEDALEVNELLAGETAQTRAEPWPPGVPVDVLERHRRGAALTVRVIDEEAWGLLLEVGERRREPGVGGRGEAVHHIQLGSSMPGLPLFPSPPTSG